jgi:hypothetical protein
MLYSILPLNTFLRKLPDVSNCMYLHDIAILPVARGSKASIQYIEYIKTLSCSMGIKSLAGVLVYGTHVLWSRFGFQNIWIPDLSTELASYGETSKYIVCHLFA